MASKGKTKGPSEETKRPSVIVLPATDQKVADFPRLAAAMEDFIRENANFESSIVATSAINALNACSSLSTAFDIPLSHRVLSLESALKWALFLHLAPARAVKEGDKAWSGPAGQFSASDALSRIGAVYDTGVQVVVWEHFAVDEPESGSEDDEGDEAGDEAEPEPAESKKSHHKKDKGKK